jgi:hypothetical protein
LYVPAVPTVTLPEEAVPPARVPLVVENAGPAHVVSPGAKSWKVTEPDGEKPPVNVAESETLPPGGTLPDGVVETDGVAFTTVTVSPPHALAFAMFFGSPLYPATQ